VGFLVADALAERWGLGRPRERFRGRIAQGRVRYEEAPAVGAPAAAPQVALLWPGTYMNEAGLSVGPARGSYKLPLDHLLVVHDEIDLPFGEIRARLGGGLAGHNGLKSLKRELGGADFWRVRVGVGRPDSTDPEIVAAYVLGHFQESPAEVKDLVARAAQEVERMVLQGPGEVAPSGGNDRPADPRPPADPGPPADPRPPADPGES